MTVKIVVPTLGSLDLIDTARELNRRSGDQEEVYKKTRHKISPDLLVFH
jgi:hypothetical protein